MGGDQKANFVAGIKLTKEMRNVYTDRRCEVEERNFSKYDCDDNENASPNKRFNRKNNGSARAF